MNYFYSICFQWQKLLLISVPCHDVYEGDCSADFANRCTEAFVINICQKTCNHCPGNTRNKWILLVISSMAWFGKVWYGMIWSGMVFDIESTLLTDALKPLW